MKQLKKIATQLSAAAALSLSGAALAGVVWQESGPSGAGDLLSTAQSTYDSSFNPLSGIQGFLTASIPVGGNPLYQVDLYKIRISDAAAFSARTLDTGVDTALFLFDAAGLGIYTNDDDGLGLSSLLPSGDASGPASDGIHYLAVALSGYAALDASSLAIFLTGAFTDVLGSDPAAGALAGWSGLDNFGEAPLNYSIELTGATNAELPEPGTVVLLSAAGLGLWASRRRPNKAGQQSR